MTTRASAAPGVVPRFPGNLERAGGPWSTSRLEIPIMTGGLHGYGRPIAPGPARAAPLGLLLGQQVIGVGLDEQLHEHRVHDAPSPLPRQAAVLVACRALHRSEDRARPLIHSASTVMPRIVRALNRERSAQRRPFVPMVETWPGRPTARRIGGSGCAITCQAPPTGSWRRIPGCGRSGKDDFDRWIVPRGNSPAAALRAGPVNSGCQGKPVLAGLSASSMAADGHRSLGPGVRSTSATTTA